MKRRRKPSDRKTLEAVEQQINAMLFFASVDVGVGGKPLPLSRWRQRQYLKGLMEAAEILGGKVEDWPHCEGCSRPIRGGQPYAHGDGGIYFHAKCLGRSGKRSPRWETRGEVRREMKKRAAEVRQYLRSRGAIA